MYENHPDIDTPSGRKIIWRYTSLTKLIYLLEKNKLFFCPSNLLDDPFEGSFPIINIKNIIKQHHRISRKYSDIKIYRAFERYKRKFFINSWHLNRYESDAMWKIYSKEDKCIAIKSSIDKFIASVHDEQRTIYFGRVRYIDYNKENIPTDNIFNPFFYKRKVYQHENELRALNTVENIYRGEEFNNNYGIRGIYIKCNPNILI